MLTSIYSMACRLSADSVKQAASGNQSELLAKAVELAHKGDSVDGDALLKLVKGAEAKALRIAWTEWMGINNYLMPLRGNIVSKIPKFDFSELENV